MQQGFDFTICHTRDEHPNHYSSSYVKLFSLAVSVLYFLMYFLMYSSNKYTNFVVTHQMTIYIHWLKFVLSNVQLERFHAYSGSDYIQQYNIFFDRNMGGGMGQPLHRLLTATGK